MKIDPVESIDASQHHEPLQHVSKPTLSHIELYSYLYRLLKHLSELLTKMARLGSAQIAGGFSGV